MTNEISTTLAAEINSEFAKSHALAEEATYQAREAVKVAARCGTLLGEAKEQTRGAFGEWLASNCPSIGSETAKRFIAGAKRVHERGIDTLGGAQLLLFFAQDDARPERPQVDRDPNETNWLAEVAKLTGRFAKTLDHRPASSWSDVERDTFRRQVKPIVDLYLAME